MNEWSRIVIEEYVSKHNSKKSRFLAYMVDKSYDLSYIPSDDEALLLEYYIEHEKNEELKEALEDLDDFMFNF